MSPKSLLRHPGVVSPISDFTKGKFIEVYDDHYVDPKQVKRILFCSGKFYYDLLEEQQKGKRKDVAIIRIEQLFPWPQHQIFTILKKYKGAEIVWVQEEPENMGPWTYILRKYKDRINHGIYRKASASPATGFSKVHQVVQSDLVKKAFKI